MGRPIAAGPIDALDPIAQPFVGQGLRCVLGQVDANVRGLNE